MFLNLIVILKSQSLVCRIPALLMMLYKYSLNESECIFLRKGLDFVMFGGSMNSSLYFYFEHS